MGHSLSRGGGGEKVVIQDAYINQFDSNTTKSRRQFVQREVLNIFGLPIERDTAMLYEANDWLDQGTVRNAPIIDLEEEF